mmetsp:Transcript_28002/g.64620  ORF Transcript_28002/g.64620 Transcript_28002/m.64620 type:complete len:400 (+) Transcript_28002:51-1250(+)
MAALDAVRTSWGIDLNDAAKTAIEQEYGSLSRQHIEAYVKDVDIRRFGVSSTLPKEVARQGTCTLPPGKYLVQLQKAVDITQPTKFQEDFEGGKWRLLALDLAVGDQKLRAIEYSQSKVLGVNVAPGSKLLLDSSDKRPLKIQNGHLLLTGENVQLIGGQVEKLLESWRISKDVASSRLLWKNEGVKKASAGEGAPPWVDFDPKKARGGSAVDKKAIEEEKASWLRQGSAKPAAGASQAEGKEARFQVQDYAGAESAVGVKSTVGASAFKREEAKGKGKGKGKSKDDGASGGKGRRRDAWDNEEEKRAPVAGAAHSLAAFVKPTKKGELPEDAINLLTPADAEPAWDDSSWHDSGWGDNSWWSSGQGWSGSSGGKGGRSGGKKGGGGKGGGKRGGRGRY